MYIHFLDYITTQRESQFDPTAGKGSSSSVDSVALMALSHCCAILCYIRNCDNGSIHSACGIWVKNSLIWCSPMVPRGVTWSHVESRGVTWSHVESRGVTWSHVESRGVTWCHVVSRGVCHVVSRGVTWC